MVYKALILYTLFSIVPNVLGLASRNGLQTREEIAASRLIVRLKKGATPDSLVNPVSNIIAQWDILPGFVVNKKDVDIDQLKSDPSVIYVREDGVVRKASTLTQTDASWALGRLHVRKASSLGSLDMNALDYKFKYDNTGGTDVDIYVVDSGVRTSHQAFGGRARWGKTFGGYPDRDDDGHGTHVAALAAGDKYGVARAANIIAVKVLGAEGGGLESDVISGIEWAAQQAKSSGRSSVINISMGTSVGAELEDIVLDAIDDGVHVVVAAGNENRDAVNYSPAEIGRTITVGASNITDQRWIVDSDNGSNFGKSVDIYAPGEDIISASHQSDTGTETYSGTSMATGLVSGVVAYLISTEGQRTPAKMKDLLMDGLGSFSVPEVTDGLSPEERLVPQIDKCDYWCYAWYWLAD